MIRKKTQLFRLFRAHRDNESGQALVELALTMPLLVLVLLGAAELARVAYTSIEVTDAAKAAVQTGGFSRSNAASSARVKAAAAAGAPDITLGTTNVTTFRASARTEPPPTAPLVPAPARMLCKSLRSQHRPLSTR